MSTDKITQLWAWKEHEEKTQNDRTLIQHQIDKRLLILERQHNSVQQEIESTLKQCKLLAESQKDHARMLGERHDRFVESQKKAHQIIENSFASLSALVLENTQSNLQIHTTVKVVGWVFGFFGTVTAMVGCGFAVMTYLA